MKSYKCSLNFRTRGTMCDNSTSFEFLTIHSLAYLPYTYLCENPVSFQNQYWFLLNLQWPKKWKITLQVMAPWLQPILGPSDLAKGLGFETQWSGGETHAGPLPLSFFTWGCQLLVWLGLLLCIKRKKKRSRIAAPYGWKLQNHLSALIEGFQRAHWECTPNFHKTLI